MSGLVESSADARSKTIGGNFRCRAWACFNSSGIRASNGIASISHDEGGHYTVTMATAMPHDDYAVAGVVDGYNTNFALNNAHTPTTTVFKIQTRDTVGGSCANTGYVSLAVFA